MRVPNCHADRAHYARGFCRSCYEKDLKARNPDYAQRQRENVRAWVAANPDRKRRSDEASQRRESRQAKRERMLRANYGMTQEEFDARLAEQDHACALCRRPARKWHVDHNHDTGAVRAILCSRCNCGLGWFDDDAANLRRAADYLELHHERDRAA